MPINAACPVCSERDARLIYETTLSTAEHTKFVTQVPTVFFSDIRISLCSFCGHAWNRAYKSTDHIDPYANAPLPGYPVSPDMHQRYHKLLSFISHCNLEGKTILEIGSGSGHLARLVAPIGKSVTVIDPCRSLTTDLLPESNINLISEYFSADHCINNYDFIFCRQVLEHTEKPIDFLRAIHAALAPDGQAYIEIPRAEFIYDHQTVLDLHFSHIQYFTEQTFLMAATCAQFSIEKRYRLLNGHDIGFLLSSSSVKQHQDSLRIGNSLRFKVNFPDVAASYNTYIKSLTGAIALYGANTNGQVFFNLIWNNDQDVAVAIDDSPYLTDFYLYNQNRLLKIVTSEQIDLQQYAHVVITAFLHQAAIMGRLTSLGYQGHIHTFSADGTLSCST